VGGFVSKNGRSFAFKIQIYIHARLTTKNTITGKTALYLIKEHAVRGRGKITPLILNLGTTSRGE
jgi:hypothetical protein